MGGFCGKENKKVKKNPNSSLNAQINTININTNNIGVLGKGSSGIMNHNLAARSNIENFPENSPYLERNTGINEVDYLNLNVRNYPLNNIQQENNLEINMNQQNSNDHNANNISINDELSISRYNNINNLNRNDNIDFLRNEGRSITNNQNISNTNSFNCTTCTSQFRNNDDLELHYISCRRVRDNHGVNSSINEIFRLFQSLNRQIRINERMTLLDLITGEEPEEQTEYIDWALNINNDGLVTWKNSGKIMLSKEKINEIAGRLITEVSADRYFIKRIWFMRYVNKHIYDKSGNNTTLVVSRENILEESFNQFMTTDELDLKKAMHIFFVDEVAHDIGGVYREWYTNMFEIIFSPDQNFFVQIDDNCPGKNSFFIPTTLPKIHGKNYLEYYEFIGKVLSKAIFDKITLKTNFNIVLIKMIMNIKIELEDLKYLDNSYYNSLKSILESSIDSTLGLTFTWNLRDQNNNFEEVELIPNGKNVHICNENKKVFVDKVVDLISYKSISSKVNAMLKGFYSVIPVKLVKLFSPFEFDFLLSGQSVIDLKDWMANTIYKGYYNEKHPNIKMFWEVLRELPPEKLTVFYRFCTGGTRVPIDGFNSLQGTRNKYIKFCIENTILKEAKSKNRLIEAKTCFNRINLPDYESKELMTKAVNTIIDNDTNFFGKE